MCAPVPKYDSACYKVTQAKRTDVDRTVFSRGWADLGNYASDRRGVPLTPGRACTVTLDLAATDHVLPKGHRLALIVGGTDKDLIDPPASTPTLTVDLSRPAAHVPPAGGTAAFARAVLGNNRPTAPRTATPDGERARHTVHRVPGDPR
jgi:X-Pro dipeptidyl-peptidase